MSNPEVRIRPVGEGARLIELGEAAPETTARARALAERIVGERWPGIDDVLPAYRTVLIRFDPCRTTGEAVDERVRAALATLGPAALGQGRIVEIPVCYGGASGPDLNDVAAHTGLSPEEVVRRHAGALYRVEVLGFSPGFPFLSGLPPELATPRLDTPRTRVPAGSVAIAGPQTGFYPLSSPGGWRLIGRIPDLGFDPARPETLPYGPGDLIRFVAVPPQTSEASPAPAERASVSAGKGQGRSAPDTVSEIDGMMTPAGSSAHPRQPEGRVLLVHHPGPHTSVQDLGRLGLAAMGYAPAGALDRQALQTANALVGNAMGAAALEIALAGAEFEAECDLIVAVTGADLTPLLAGEPLPIYRAACMRPGARLRFAATKHGLRAYLAIQGGIAVPEVLGSRSTDLVGGIGGLEARLPRAGDRLPIGEGAGSGLGYALPVPHPIAPSHLTLRVVWGPEDDWFDEQAQARFTGTAYHVSDRGDRTGVRLVGEPLRSAARSLASEGAVPGAIQVPPDGQPIVLLADSRGVGGYPKIAVVVEADLDLLAQAAPGTSIRFRAVSEQEARRLARAYRAALAALPLRPLPELAVRCLREVGATDSAMVLCPRTLDCVVSRRCARQA